MTETNEQTNIEIYRNALLIAVSALHEQWIIETDRNRNVELWDEDEEWSRITDKLIEAKRLVVKGAI